MNLTFFVSSINFEAHFPFEQNFHKAKVSINLAKLNPLQHHKIPHLTLSKMFFFRSLKHLLRLELFSSRWLGRIFIRHNLFHAIYYLGSHGKRSINICHNISQRHLMKVWKRVLKFEENYLLFKLERVNEKSKFSCRALKKVIIFAFDEVNCDVNK